MSQVQIETSGGVGTLWLNRPELHNAFDDALIAEVTKTAEALGTTEAAASMRYLRAVRKLRSALLPGREATA